MDPFGFVIFSLIFFISLLYSYEVWFTPEKFQKRIAGRRKSAKNIFGLSFWNTGQNNIYFARFAYTFILIVSLLGLVASIISSQSASIK